jgi:hypothetical protein
MTKFLFHGKVKKKIFFTPHEVNFFYKLPGLHGDKTNLRAFFTSLTPTLIYRIELLTQIGY